MAIQSKDELTEQIRQLLDRRVPVAIETDDAEALLNALSYQSRHHPQRHVWIEIEPEEFTLDLEDWHNSAEWDDTVLQIVVEAEDDVIELVETWLAGRAITQLHMNGHQTTSHLHLERERIS